MTCRLILLATAFVLPLVPATSSSATSRAAPIEAAQARFEPCGSAKRITCVVDGDTFWYAGTKIRIADINTPETANPSCAYEAALGARAKLRLAQLLNAGPFKLEVRGREVDRYGRALRVVTRDGKSLGAKLADEGLAEIWQGKRGDWCKSAA